jgi:hypothetical protein
MEVGEFRPGIGGRDERLPSMLPRSVLGIELLAADIDIERS